MIDILVLTLLVMAVGYLFTRFGKKTKPDIPKEEPKAEIRKPEPKPERKESDHHQPSMKQLLKQEGKKSSKHGKAHPTHPLYFKGFKGFSEGINDFDVSPDGKYVAACSSDLTLKVYILSKHEELEPFSQSHKLGYDIPSVIGISKNGRSVALGYGEMKKVELFDVDIDKNPSDPTKPIIKIQSSEKSYDVKLKSDLNHFYLDAEKRYYLVGSSDTDTHVDVYDCSGNLLSNFNTSQMRNVRVARNQAGNLYAFATKTSDVPIFEVKFDRQNAYKGTHKVMLLAGHTKEINEVAFDNNDEKVITVSADNTIRLWNVKVEYELKEDAKIIEVYDIKNSAELSAIRIHRVALFVDENNHNILIVAEKNNLIFFDFTEKKVIQNINGAHPEAHTINKLIVRKFEGKWYLYSSADDGRVNMWKL